MEANREYFRAVSVFTNYEVSNVGRVRNSKTGRILKPNARKDGYLDVTLSKEGATRRYLIHRLVAAAFLENPCTKRCVDPIDSDKKNNIVDNLRYATHSENSRCVGKIENTSSIYKGVSLYKPTGKWKTQISVNGRVKHLGYYTDEREAAAVYNAAADMHGGDFARLNDLTIV